MARLGVDDLKLWLARMYCGKEPNCIETCLKERELAVAFLQDGYPTRYHTIVVSLSGSPPKAQAFLYPINPTGWNPGYMTDFTVRIGSVVLFSLGKKRSKVSIVDPWELNLSEFFERDDCVVMNNPFARISSKEVKADV